MPKTLQVIPTAFNGSRISISRKIACSVFGFGYHRGFFVSCHARDRAAKKTAGHPAVYLNERNESAGNDAVGRAHFGASTAARAEIGIDHTNITLLADCINGTFGFAGAAINAIILVYDISHDLPPNGIVQSSK